MQYDSLCLWAPPARKFGPLSPANDCSFWRPLQDRPCTRCIQRNIGHLCHDESRETSSRKLKSEPDRALLNNESSKHELGKIRDMPAFPPRGESGHSFLQDGDAGLRPSTREGVPPGSNSSTTQDHGSDSTTQPRELSQTGWLSQN
jgi:hypothetical protein